MTENVKIEAKGFQDLCNYIAELEENNKFLKHQNEILKIHEERLVEENEELRNKLNNVTLWDLSDEEQERAGKAFAQELLRGA